MIADYSFEHDGTKVTFRVVNKHLKPWDYWSAVGLELKNHVNGFNFENLTIKSQKNSPELVILPPPKK
jgi:hypothetical protein